MFLQKAISVLFDEIINQRFLFLVQRAGFLIVYKEFLYEHIISDQLRTC